MFFGGAGKERKRQRQKKRERGRERGREGKRTIKRCATWPRPRVLDVGLAREAEAVLRRVGLVEAQQRLGAALARHERRTVRLRALGVGAHAGAHRPRPARLADTLLGHELRHLRRPERPARAEVAHLTTITKKSGKIFRVGIFLDFVWRSGTTRTMHPMWGVRAESQTKSN